MFSGHSKCYIQSFRIIQWFIALRYLPTRARRQVGLLHPLHIHKVLARRHGYCLTRLGLVGLLEAESFECVVGDRPGVGVADPGNRCLP